MLTVLLFYLLITLSCLWTGYLIRPVFRLSASGAVDPPQKPPLVYIFWGLITITGAAQVLELFFPVNNLFWPGWICLLILVTFLRKQDSLQLMQYLRQTVKEQAGTLTLTCITLLFVSNLGAGPLLMDDTESYHIQMIKWIQEYGTVPGLANLHERYGFNSSWFTWAALVIPTHTATNYFTLANGALSVWFCLYLLQKAFTSTQEDLLSARRSLAACLVLLTALLCWPMIRGNATNANYDFITTCLLVVLVIESAAPAAGVNDYMPEYLVWPVFLCTVRIVNAPLLVLSVFGIATFLRTKQVRSLMTGMTASLLLAVPFLIRNVVLSGYLFYPAYQIDLFRVDWKADIRLTRNIVEYIKYFNRVNSGTMPISETSRLGFPAWIPVWFHYLFGYDKPVLLTGLAGYGFCGLRRQRFRQLPLPARVLAGSLVLQLAAWFWIAPDPRFVYGPLLGGIFLLALLLPPVKWSTWFLQFRKPVLTLLLTTMFGYTTWKLVRHPQYRQLLIPVVVPQPPCRVVWVDGIELRIPEKMNGNWNPRCYATGLPCLYELQPGLRARGKTVSDGFRLER